jgi:hypothetical protein
MTLADKLKLAADVVDDALTTLKSDGSADGWLLEYRLTEAGLQLKRAVRELAGR